MGKNEIDPERLIHHAEALERIEVCRREQRPALDLSCLRLERLPPQVLELTHLTSLSLYDNEFSTWPVEIFRLFNLEKLDFSRNHLVDVHIDIRNLPKLKVLSMWDNQLQAFPSVVCELVQLTELLIGDNHLSIVPPEISALEKLSVLSLDRASLGILSAEVCNLPNLTTLRLSRNFLSTLPREIGRLAKLTTLSLVGNKLTMLPRELVRLNSLDSLYLHGNPALAIPESILGPTYFESEQPARPHDILNFYFSQREAAATGTLQPLNEVKLMLVGRGGAGKTSLRRFFKGESHNRDEPETPGIALDSFTLQCERGPVTVRLWDFAGQEITHALHKFFLTEGCIYVLALDPRSNTETQDAEYWLGLLKRYAGGAPVLLALNRQDARLGGYDVDRRVLMERFPFIHSFTNTNCEKRETCEGLRDMLRDAIEALKETEPPHLRVPETWIRVIEDCDGETASQAQPRENRLLRWLGLAGHHTPERKGRPHLTLEEFRSICDERGETALVKQESLARLLHKLGAVLHFVDEPRLRDTAVLNPHWVTDGVYRLLRFKDRPQSDGTLTLAEALEALPGETETTARFLLRLMERFEMCFPLDDEEGGKLPTHWLIPGALGEFQPDGVTAEWQKRSSVRLRYIYDPLPEGVLPRFIVMTNLLSEGKPRWRNGVILQDGQAKGLVRRGAKREYVEVTAVGPEDERLRLLEIIQGTLERIHSDLPDPKPIAEIELAGLPGIYRSVADLEAAEIGRQQVAIDTQQGTVLVEPTVQLNQASEEDARAKTDVPLRTFLSYSYKDKKAKAIFQDNLTVMMKKNLITPWHDGLIEPGMCWHEDVERNLTRADVFVGLLTTAFLAADYLERVSVKMARKRLHEMGRELLFVLILVDEISLDGLDLSDYHVLKPSGKAVCNHPSRKDGFNAAQKELEVLLLNHQQAKRGEERDCVQRQPPEFSRGVPGITVIVKGDLVKGDKPMNFDSSVHVHGNAMNSQVGQILSNCSLAIEQHDDSELKKLLTGLESVAKELLTRLHTEKHEEVAGNLELAVKAITSRQPNRAWYSVSAAGLLQAAEFAQDLSGKLVAQLSTIGKLIWPDFEVPS